MSSANNNKSNLIWSIYTPKSCVNSYLCYLWIQDGGFAWYVADIPGDWLVVCIPAETVWSDRRSWAHDAGWKTCTDCTRLILYMS